MKTRLIRLSASVFLATLLLSAFDAFAGQKATLYRDTWGVPNIYADSEEAACFAMGYAQAEDRIEQIFDNYRRAIGCFAEIAGGEEVFNDFRSRIWRHAAVSKKSYDTLSPKTRACFSAFQAGVRQYLKDHPDKKPKSYVEMEPWMCAALTRAVIYPWPEGQIFEELVAGGVKPEPVEYRGSNEMALAPSKTKDKIALTVIDPHLGFYGAMRFYEARLYGGTIHAAGTAVTGLPMVSLGHSEYMSVAMTTGGPDTADVFMETINPDNPRQYQYNGQWRDGDLQKIRIAVKTKDGKIDEVTRDVLYTHHGPVIAAKDGKGYAAAIAYAEEIGLADQMFKLYTAKSMDEIKAALSMAQLMPQNVMIGTVDGDIYYQRTGKVPVRPEGFDYTRPVPGDTDKTEWKGFHPTSDLVQILNPPCGWMQNCNVSPRVMFRDSPLTEDKYKSYLYMEPQMMGIKYGLHQRAAMAFELLDKVQNATVEDLMEIALSPDVFGAKPWQDRLRTAWDKADAQLKADESLSKFVETILTWNRRAEKDSAGVMCYNAWKEQQGRTIRLRDRVGSPPPPSMTDEEVIRTLKEGHKKMLADYGSIQIKYGDIYRAGRKGGKVTAPVDGGGIDGIATPRNLGFGHKLEGKQRLMTGGQCSPQIVKLTKPPQSWSAAPLGQSDDPQSPHFDDQAIKLVSNRKMKSTYFKDKETLLKNLESTKELVYEK